jgi:hypothetical protein
MLSLKRFSTFAILIKLEKLFELSRADSIRQESETLFVLFSVHQKVVLATQFVYLILPGIDLSVPLLT